LEFCKSLDIKDIKTSDNIIIATKTREDSEWEEQDLVIIHWKEIIKTIEFIKNKYILIEKIIICDNAEIFSNSELKSWDVVIPNTFISAHPQPLPNKEGSRTIFLENTIWKDYDLNNFWLLLNWICSEEEIDESEFQADVKSENIFIFLLALENEELLEKTTVVLQIGEENYINLIAVSDMMI
jgi:hypothetical protein